MSRGSRHLVAAAVLGAVCFAAATPSAAAGRSAAPAAKDRAAAITDAGAFEFEGIAGHTAGKGCRGEGAFGEAKPGARVTVSERNAAGDFSTLAKGKVAKGKVVRASGGDKVCRMAFRAKARVAPANDSSVYLEVKGLTFDLRFPAADVADGDLGTWTCGFSDNTCARVVGGG